MRDVINAGVDPHRWFAGVRAGLITNDTEFTKDPERVREVNELLKEKVTKTERQHSKAAKPNWPFRERSLSKKKVNCWKAWRTAS